VIDWDAHHTALQRRLGAVTDFAVDGMFDKQLLVLLYAVLCRHVEPVRAAHRLGGDSAVAAVAGSIVEAEVARLDLPDEDPGAWIIPPVGVGTAHVTPYGQRVYDYEVGVAPLLFGRARIFQGPVGRREIDKAWEYRTAEEAVMAFAVWLVNGFEGEPQNPMRVTGSLHDNSRPLCSKCMLEVKDDETSVRS
jgi:hypothetical protein